MAKLCMIKREKKRVKEAKLNAKKRDILRKVINDPEADLDAKEVAQAKMQALPRDSAKIRQSNRCAITGRARGVYRKFGLCRHKLRELAMSGFIPGLHKASW